MKIYTKTGDGGTTSLFGGKRVVKDSARVVACGEVDELNSLIGTIVAENPTFDMLQKLIRIQDELFVLGTDLASPLEVRAKIPRITGSFITRLEREIDSFDKKLAPLKNFILPGGGNVGSRLHLARSVTRRAERSIVALSEQEKINPTALSYINRLSDWFFILARHANKIEKQKEIIWKGRGK